jgi:hypothetical protein
MPLNGTRGQTQILAAAIIGTVMVTGALFSMRRALEANVASIHLSQRSEMRAALEKSVLYASHIYHSLAGCDPKILDDVLTGLSPGTGAAGAPEDSQLAGSQTGVQNATYAQLRQINVTVNSHVYTVAFGPVYRLGWNSGTDPTSNPAGTYNAGTSQDAVVEVWTTNELITGVKPDRVTQFATLVNNCTYPCAAPIQAGNANTPALATTNWCQIQFDSAVGYQQIAGPGLTTNQPVASVGTCGTGTNTSYLADFDGDGWIDLPDLIGFSHWMRTYEFYNNTVNANYSACGDLNGDGVVNDTDLGILEKYMRGYLYWLPTQL